MTHSAHHNPTETPHSFAVQTPLPEHIEAFSKLYQEKFGVPLSTEEAMEQLTHLFAIVRYKRDNARHQLKRKHRPSKIENLT